MVPIPFYFLAGLAEPALLESIADDTLALQSGPRRSEMYLTRWGPEKWVEVVCKKANSTYYITV